MTLPDDDFDPDDNYTGDTDSAEIDNDASAEVLVWQLLLVINPGDEDAAMQQFAAFQEALDGGDAEDVEVSTVLDGVIDWKSGFHVGENEHGALVECLTELAARFNLSIDWDVEDPTDDASLASVATATLLETAYDQLRLDGYTLWTRETGDDTVAGWMTLSSDNEAMRILVSALGIDVRPAGT